MSSRGPHCWKIHVITAATGVLSSFSVLEKVNVKVDGAVEGSEEVAGAGHIGQPAGPSQLSRVLSSLGPFPDIWDPLNRVTQYKYCNNCYRNLSEAYFPLLSCTTIACFLLNLL